MVRQFRLLALILFTTAGMAWPAEVAAQRHAPRSAPGGGAGHRGVAVPRGGPVGVAVPRAYPSRYYRSYTYPRYYYPYAYPRYYGYSPWYYSPYYSCFGFSFGVGWPGAVWGGVGYGYPYRYSYPYAYGYPSVYSYPPSVYVRPAPYPPQVVERDQGQQPSYGTGEQAGFGTLS